MYYLIGSIALLSICIILFLKASRNRHSLLYQEGVRHENNGEYLQAIDNFMKAKTEIEKVKGKQKQVLAISNRIKTLHAMLNYESNFHKEDHHGIA